ncbi:hypothetical protein ACQKLP_10930 [Chitinophaga sp. NPDC101104]|uniref:hypothetical protein n=1 Tax=Chitinophaga sp. NPDC101104 TaxID=3390561 RepID=UPI003D01E6CB
MIKMKPSSLAFAFFIFVANCDSGASSIKNISGKYNRIDSNEYSILHQTVLIEPQAGDADKYRLTIHSIVDFHDDRPNDTTERFANATYDPQSAMLSTDQQLVYSFDPQKGLLRVNNIEYRKE